MKKQLIFLSGAILLTLSVLLNGCSKDEDTTAPNITLTGASDMTITKGATWSDPGATASDDEDGDLTGQIVITGSVDANVAGVYHLTYTATDKAGNSSDVSRTVTVSWSGAQLAGSYNVTDTCIIAGSPNISTYTSVATASIGQTYRALFSNLSTVFTGNTYMDITAGNFTIPAQYPNGTGSVYEVTGSGTISVQGSNIVWDMNYSVRDTTDNTTSGCHAVFVSQ